MKYRVHGIRFAKGNFTDRGSGVVIEYDNIVFNCTHPSTDDQTVGDSVIEVKIKRSLIGASDHELKQLIGKDVIFDIMPTRGGKAVYTGYQILNK